MIPSRILTLMTLQLCYYEIDVYFHEITDPSWDLDDGEGKKEKEEEDEEPQVPSMSRREMREEEERIAQAIIDQRLREKREKRIAKKKMKKRDEKNVAKDTLIIQELTVMNATREVTFKKDLRRSMDLTSARKLSAARKTELDALMMRGETREEDERAQQSFLLDRNRRAKKKMKKRVGKLVGNDTSMINEMTVIDATREVMSKKDGPRSAKKDEAKSKKKVKRKPESPKKERKLSATTTTVVTKRNVSKKKQVKGKSAGGKGGKGRKGRKSSTY